MCEVQISDADRLLINELKSKIQYELELVPSYSDDLSLLSCLMLWLLLYYFHPSADVIVPKIQFSLRAIHALGLHNEDLSTLDKVTAKC
ncbi:unnamed protein product, partial [Heligmosomoides polygyrus]|uniref:Cyclin_C domain-containing protein n=1 Tax=Heligmosomoides polygyrus TaxID=6339 RepID=A0A183FAH9_HELPZ